MLLKQSRQRGSQAREPNWFAIALDFVIVILGVFLGIQAANWNEARQDRTQERRYYAQIVEDLRRDQQSLERAQRKADDFDAAAENTLQAIRSGLPPNISAGRFAADIHYAGFLYIPRTTRSTYDELISTGNLGLLRSETAKRDIAEYYASWGDQRQWDELLRLQQARYWELAAGVLPRPALKAAMRGREPKLSQGEAAEILSRLRSRDGVVDNLTSMAAHQERIRRDSEELSKEGRELINELTRLGRM